MSGGADPGTWFVGLPHPPPSRLLPVPGSSELQSTFTRPRPAFTALRPFFSSTRFALAALDGLVLTRRASRSSAFASSSASRASASVRFAYCVRNRRAVITSTPLAPSLLPASTFSRR